MTTQKTLLLIEDISCVGRCAAMVALPVLSCAGIHVSLLPTALLSAHTGGFGAVYKRDLTQDMQETLGHWADVFMHFDAIHVGYLASAAQIPLVRQAVDRYQTLETLLFVDPVMGDWGKRYQGSSEALVDGFRALCHQASLIFPNRTETALLLDQPYEKGVDKPEQLLHQLRELLSLGAQAAVITGVSTGDGFIGAAALDGGMTAPAIALQPQLPGHWPGTGDLFASAVEAALLRGKSLTQAIDVGAKFIYHCLKLAPNAPVLSRFGAPFELSLPWLIDALGD